MVQCECWKEGRREEVEGKEKRCVEKRGYFVVFAEGKCGKGCGSEEGEESGRDGGKGGSEEKTKIMMTGSGTNDWLQKA